VFLGPLGIYAGKLLHPLLAGKLDLSGVVQQTLMEAIAAVPPDDPAEVGYWLRALLKRNFNDEVRKLMARKRDVRREVCIATQDQASSDPSPSRLAAKADDLLAIAAGLSQLPMAQQQVIQLRYFENYGLNEIAARTNKTEAAIAGLLRRGILALRKQLSCPS
jgi:RNA polymerase sigma factor (sigma-70 family)